MKIYDVTVPLEEGMFIYEGDPEFRIKHLKSGCSFISELSLGSHTGTHIDAPSHYFSDAENIDEIPPENFFGEAEVVSFPKDSDSEIILWKNFECLTEEYAKYLVKRDVRIVGCDSPSIGNDAVHKILLKNDILIIEMLDLSNVPEGVYYLTALPLKIKGSDASPARVILKK